MSDGTRVMAVLALGIAVYAIEQAGWAWPAQRFDAWMNGGGAR